MSIEEYKYLWDGSEPDWVLHHIDQTVWYLVFEFGANGPEKEVIVKLHNLVPELQIDKITNIYKKLKDTSNYRTENYYGNIEAVQLERKASELGLNVKLEKRQIGGYLPVDSNNIALVIEDDEIAEIVGKKMLEAGVKVIEIHVD